MWLDSKAVKCPQKWGNFTQIRESVLGRSLSEFMRTRVIVKSWVWTHQAEQSRPTDTQIFFDPVQRVSLVRDDTEVQK